MKVFFAAGKDENDSHSILLFIENDYQSQLKEDLSSPLFKLWNYRQYSAMSDRRPRAEPHLANTQF